MTDNTTNLIIRRCWHCRRLVSWLKITCPHCGADMTKRGKE